MWTLNKGMRGGFREISWISSFFIIQIFAPVQKLQNVLIPCTETQKQKVQMNKTSLWKKKKTKFALCGEFAILRRSISACEMSLLSSTYCGFQIQYQLYLIESCSQPCLQHSLCYHAALIHFAAHPLHQVEIFLRIYQLHSMNIILSCMVNLLLQFYYNEL